MRLFLYIFLKQKEILKLLKKREFLIFNFKNVLINI